MTSNKKNKAAFLWDESFLWGLMAYKALCTSGLPFELIRAEDIRKGALDEYPMLFVPGGWASNKSGALGEKGLDAIRQFVEKGGSYLGFCGGAGLATNARGCLGLLDVDRKPTNERVPSFSGRIELKLHEHEIWTADSPAVISKDSIEDDLPIVTHKTSGIYHAWWPSQFTIKDSNIKVLASYGKAMPDSFSSDLNVGDVRNSCSWHELEEQYKINLDPGKLFDEPAVIEGKYGRGRVMISLVHFDTQGDPEGAQALERIWSYLGGLVPASEKNTATVVSCGREKDAVRVAGELYAISRELVSLGERNFLWFWRNAMLLHWRRGVRGLEYNTLFIMIREIFEQARNGSDISVDDLKMIRRPLKEFALKAAKLLVLERFEMQKGNFMTFADCDNPEVRVLRGELFSASKSHGGRFKELLDITDSCLIRILTGNEG
ncbi:MAG: hypothetical protein ISR96_04175 [Nitrospira sp.]|nr:hypothetical protein [bacterium]MBL7048708.1 hypothetical protein [Nitrospira sp.]